MAQTRGQPDKTTANEDMIRHMVINSLRGFNVKFKQSMVRWYFVQTQVTHGVEIYFHITNIVERKVEKNHPLIGITSST